MSTVWVRGLGARSCWQSARIALI